MSLQALENNWFRQTAHINATAMPTWLLEYREQQRAAFMKHGIPARNNERWKYADLGSVAQQHFAMAGSPVNIEHENVNAHRINDNDALLLVFVDGRFAATYSDIDQLPKGVIACSLLEALVKHEELIKDNFNQDISAREYPFAALNSALFTDGLFLYVPQGVKLNRQLHILSLASGREAAMVTPHHLFVLGEGSEATIINEYAGVEGGKYFTNAVTSINANANSRLTLIKLQHENDDALHMENFFVKQRRDSNINITHVTTGAIFSRDDVIVQLKESGAECETNGFYHASRDGQYVDHHIDVDHSAPRTNSGMLYKGIAEKKSRAVFNGSLYVEKDAQKINAYQENHNLLLSGLAEVYSKPELEIYADDVKCRHGATTGQLDQDAMFYMRARGIDKVSAMNILLRGYVDEVLQRIAHSALREHAMKQVKFL